MNKWVEFALIVVIIAIFSVLAIIGIRIRHETTLPGTETTLERTICTDEAPCD